MRSNIVHRWACDEEHFEDEAGLAQYLAACIDAGEAVLRFMREGCMFRLTYQDEADSSPMDSNLRQRTYLVELMTNSPLCTGGNRFTSEWPDAYQHRPGPVVADDAAEVMQIAGGTYGDCLSILTRITQVMWPDRNEHPSHRSGGAAIE